MENNIRESKDLVLEKEVESLTRELSVRYEELSALYRISAQLKEQPTPRSLLSLILNQVQEILKTRYISLIILGEDSPLQEEAGKEPAPLDLGRLWKNAREKVSFQKEGVIINSDGTNRHSILVVPFYTNRILGFLQLADKISGEEFTSGDKKLVSALAQVGAVALENVNLYQQLQDLFLGTVRSLSAAIDAKNPYTKGHSARVSEYALNLAGELNLTKQDRERLYLSCLLHDIGKIGIPGHILAKAGKLTNEEMNLTRLHSLSGAEILEGIKPLKDVIPVIRHHHEHFDGRGYPYGLKGNQIPFFARILTLADAYDAMTSDRPYRSKIPEDKAVKEIIDNKGKQFDPQVVDAFLRARQKGGIRTNPECSNSKEAILRDAEVTPDRMNGIRHKEQRIATSATNFFSGLECLVR